MAKKTEKVAFIVEMEIDLPDGETTVSQKEKDAISRRIFGYLSEIGTTSDEYEGCLHGVLKNGEWKYSLSVVDVPTELKVVVNIGGGLVQGVRTNYHPIKCAVYDEDDKKAEGQDSSDVDSTWETEIPKTYPYGIQTQMV